MSIVDRLAQNRSWKKSWLVYSIRLCLLEVVFSLVGFSYGAELKAESTLKFLSIVHRHGERPPYLTFPKEPYDRNTIWPEGKRQLTKKGKQNIFRNGQLLRERYDGFLPKEYRPEDIYVRSSDVDRTIMSAQVLLAGLYPPLEKQIWNPTIQWQPIPVHTIPAPMDDMIHTTRPCPYLKAEEGRIETEQNNKVIEEHKELLEYLKNATEAKIAPAILVYALLDYNLMLGSLGLAVPEWATNDVQEKLHRISKMHFRSFYSSQIYKKLCSGVLINDIIENMKKKASSEEKFGLRMNIYSGHEVTIYPLWHALGVVQEAPVPPSLGATMIIELHEINNKHFVKVLYKNYGSDRDLSTLNIKGCETENSTAEMCDFDVFSRVLEPVLIKDFQKECEIPAL